MIVPRFVARLGPLLLLAACSGSAAPVPEPPGWLERPAEYAWGDTVASADNRLARHVHGALRRTYGRPSETHYVARNAAALRGLKDWYAARIGDGWTPLPLPFLPPDRGFGFTDGRRALVFAWLPPQDDGGIPITLFRFDAAG